MATYSEQVLESIMNISGRDRCSLFDACVAYCEEQDIEVEELVAWLDPHAIKMIRQSALDSNKVRKCVETKPDELDFE